MSVNNLPMSEVFPGETVTFDSGRVVTVSPWGAHALVHEVPAFLGRIFGNFAPLGADLGEPGKIMARLPALIEVAAGDLANLVCFSAKMQPEELKELTGADFVKLCRAVFRQNLPFFVEAAGMYREVAESGLLGRRLQSSSPQ